MEHIEALRNDIYYLNMYTKELKHEVSYNCYPRAKMFIEMQRNTLESMKNTLDKIIEAEQQKGE